MMGDLIAREGRRMKKRMSTTRITERMAMIRLVKIDARRWASRLDWASGLSRA